MHDSAMAPRLSQNSPTSVELEKNQTMRRYWLFKSEPDVFSIQDLATSKGKRTSWEGVRNYQARNMLRDDIKKGDDPNSSVVKQNLVETCRRCHPGASDTFPAAWTAHYEPDRKKWPVVYWVNVFYQAAIPGILGMFGFYIVLELAHTLVTWIKRRRQG